MFVRLLRERGDTIVEVLIALAVISMVLGGAYVATNSSIRTSRATEEQGNALKLAESQVEQIKSMMTRDPNQVLNAPHASFCIYQNAVFGSDDAKCRVDHRGEETTGQPQYSLGAAEAGNTFTVTVQWDKQDGSQGRVRMLYRIHE